MTWHRMLIVNADPHFRKMLWPGTIVSGCKDHCKETAKGYDCNHVVLEPKSLSKLLEVIDSSQLPDLPKEGALDPINAHGKIMKLVHNGEATLVRGVTRVPKEKQKFDSYNQLGPQMASLPYQDNQLCLKASICYLLVYNIAILLSSMERSGSDRLTAECGSVIDDPSSPFGQTEDSISMFPS